MENFRRIIKLKYIWQLLLITTLLFQDVRTQDFGNEKIKEFNLIFSSSFFEHMNEMDVRASLHVWSQQYINGWANYSGQNMNTKVIFTNEIKNIKEIIESKVTSLFTIDIINYIEEKLDEIYEPVFVGTIDSIAMVELIIVVRKDSDIISIENLKNKSVKQLGGLIGQLIDVWLITQVVQITNTLPKNYFSSIENERKSSKALLDVYFNNFDACVILLSDYEVLCEMNPQLKRETKIIDKSDSYLPSASILINNSDKNFERFVRNFVDDIIKQPYSEQVMKIFKIDGISTYKKEYLINIKKLVEDYNRMMKNY